MAIIKVVAPSSLPITTDDYQAQNNQLIELIRNIGLVEPVDGTNIIKGAVLNVGQIIYMVDDDTAITGTPSKYVKITPSGDTLTCTASFVTDLTGVAWDKVANGYYDSGSPRCLYLFDEAMAINDGAISAVYSKFALIRTGINRIHGIEKFTGLSGVWVCPKGVSYVKVFMGAGGGSSIAGDIGPVVVPGNDGEPTSFGSVSAQGGEGGTSFVGGLGGIVSGIPGSIGQNGGDGNAATGGAGGGVLGSIGGGGSGGGSSGGSGDWGGAGGGGGGTFTSGAITVWGSGGGGAMEIDFLPVVPGESYSWAIGQGGITGGSLWGGWPGGNGSLYIEY